MPSIAVRRLRPSKKWRVASLAALGLAFGLSASAVAHGQVNPLRSIGLATRDIVVEDGVAPTRALHILTLTAGLDGALAGDVVGLAVELPGLEIARREVPEASEWTGPFVEFELPDGGGSCSLRVDVDSDGGNAVWRLEVAREQPFSIALGALRLQLFGETTSTTFVAPLPGRASATPPRWTLLGPDAGGEVSAGDVLSLSTDGFTGYEQVTIETELGPQRLLTLEEAGEGTRQARIPSGLFGPVRVMTLRQDGDNFVHEGVPIEREWFAIDARWYTAPGDPVAELTRGAELGAIMTFDLETSDPLGLELATVARLDLEGGGALHVFGSHAVTQQEVQRTVEVLRVLLADVPGAPPELGKGPLRTACADAQRVFLLGYEGEQGGPAEHLTHYGYTSTLVVAEAIHVEGSDFYVSGKWFYDAMVASLVDALVEIAFDAELDLYGRLAITAALAEDSGVYRPSGSDHTDSHFVGEYVASLFEVALGHWEGQGDDEGRVRGGMFGVSDRTGLIEADPAGWALVQGWLGETLDADLSVHPDFLGPFHLDRRVDLPYTARTQYLTRMRLLGAADSDLIGNGHANVLAGNAGDNTLVGGAGVDIAVFRGARAEYTIENIDGAARVTDSVTDRDGRDLCLGIEVLRFDDGELPLDGSVGEGPQWVSLFNGRDLEGWTPKFTHHPLGENLRDTFRVEDGLLKVRYDGWERFEGEFGHLYFEQPLANYRLRIEYRFVGEQVPGGPGWAVRNSGVMLHGQDPRTLGLHQEFPCSIEAQMLGGDGDPAHLRPTANLCTPGTHVEMEGALVKRHCTNSTSATFHGDQWVVMEIEVRGNEVIRHLIDGAVVLEYQRPQLDPADADAAALLGSGVDAQLASGYISIQAESHPMDVREIEILQLGD